MENEKKMLIVDGNSILNRAYFGVKPLTTSAGRPTGAIFGMLNILRRHLTELSPDAGAVAFDVHAPTFRHKRYDAYKAGRRPMPDDLREQLEGAHALCRAFGFTVLEQPGYEADDLLGTLAKIGSEQGCHVYILTGDRDSLQLISDSCTVLLAGNAETAVFDRAAFTEKYGVAPEQFVDVKALMGDSSDNIPGVPGIGEKGALKLIAQFGSLDGVYENTADPSLTPSLRAKLENGRDSACLSKTLAEICRTVPLDGITPDSLTLTPPEGALFELCREFEFFGTITKLGLAPASSGAAASGAAAEAIADDYAPITADDLLSLPDEPLFAVSEENGTVYLSDGTNHFVFSGTTADIGAFFECHRWCAADSKAVLRALRDAGFSPRPCEHDLSLAAYLLAPEGHFDLASLASSYLNETADPDRPGAAARMMRLVPKLENELRATGQESLYRTVELPLASVLCEMERVGFKVDREGLADFAVMLDRRIGDSAERIWQLAGAPFNINSPRQLGEVLFDRLGLPVIKKTKSGYSTDAEVLEKLRPAHPIVDEILAYRQVAKLKSTYADGLLKVADENGRVHSSFNQTVTATGRLSSSDPNLQNIPVRTELGRELRRFFVAENENYVLLDADYSQIELRLLAALSGDETMTAAFLRGADIHTDTAAQIFGLAPEAVTPELRKSAKAINFGILYGMGDYSLAGDIGVSRAAAADYIKQYLARYPAVDAYLKGAIEAARRDGYVSTLFGRRRPIPELRSPKAPIRKFGERVAMNSPIQGTAADIIKLAMIRCDAALREAGLDARLILQVHDELIVESAAACADQAAAILRGCMEHVLDLPVPLPVELGRGRDWYDAK